MSDQPSVTDFVNERFDQGMSRGDILRQGLTAGLNGRELGEALRARFGEPDTSLSAPYGPRVQTTKGEKGIPLDPDHAVRPYSS